MPYPLGLEVDGEVLLRAYSPPYSPSMADAVRAVVELKFGEGGLDRGGSPTTYPPFHCLMGFQAHHLDVEFYDRYYRPESVSERHRRHREFWHGEARPSP